MDNDVTNTSGKQQAGSFRNHIVIRENLSIAAIVAVYTVAVYGILTIYGLRDRFALIFDSDWLSRLVPSFAAIFIAFHLPKKSYRLYFTPRYLAGFLVVILLAPIFDSAFVSFKQAIPLINDFSYDASLMKLDYILHFGHHPWRFLESILAYPVLLRAIDRLYTFWVLLLFLFCLWMAWTRRRHLRLRFFVSTLAIWSLLGSGLAAIFSSAGPCFYSKVVHTGINPYAPLMLRLKEVSDDSFLWAFSTQLGLWEGKEQNLWRQFGGVSAFPSIHLAIATIFVLAAFSINRRLGILFIGYLCIMQIGSVILGWHYAVDGYAGIILACVIWYAVGRMIPATTEFPQTGEGI
jgi:hypothetical protein